MVGGQQYEFRSGGNVTLTQAYGYDGVNRLASVGETVTAGGSGGGAWSFTHGYDQFGNMWVSNASGLTAHSATPRASDQFGATTNRLTKAFDGSTLSNPYDEAGNLINHPYVGAMQYDGENRQKQFTSGSTTATYHYDGDGRRVKRVLGGQTTVFVYDAFGMLAAEYSTATPTETGGRRYRTTDHLGSTRLVTDDSGAVKTRHDYLPFGEDLPASSSAGNRNLVFGFGVSPSERHKFTGKERDAESGLDYFGARYLAASLGRFTSADEPAADQFAENPQSWNLFTYVRNNPLRLVDPDGRVAYDPCGGDPDCQERRRQKKETEEREHQRRLKEVEIEQQQGLLRHMLAVAKQQLLDPLSGLNQFLNDQIPIAPTAITTAGRQGVEIVRSFNSFEQARNAALKTLGEIDAAERAINVGRKGPLAGNMTGFKTRVNGVFKLFRVDWDLSKGAHINVTVGKTKYAFTFPGSLSEVRALVKGNVQK